MKTPKIHESEYRFCEILWENEPVKSTELVKLCRERLGWKKSTTYTVIRRLAERGALKHEDTMVESLISKDQVREYEIDEFVNSRFDGSVPQFLASFTRSAKLSDRDIEALRKMIDEYEGE